LGWFAYEPEWYDTNYTNFTQCEAQSVSLFVHYLSNVKGDAVQFGSKGNGQENGNPLADVVIFLSSTDIRLHWLFSINILV